MNWLGVVFELLQHGAQHAAMAGGVNPPAKKMARNARVLAWVAVMVLLFGAVTVAWGGWEISSGLASANWPGVQGRIIESHVVTIPQPYHDQPTAVIRYRYEVDGQIIEGHRVSFQVAPPLSAVEDYPVGRTVTVYHHPDHPDNAVLEPSMSRGDCVRIVILAVFMPVTGLIVLQLSLNMRRKAMQKMR